MLLLHGRPWHFLFDRFRWPLLLACLGGTLSQHANADAIRIDTPQADAVVYDISGDLFVEAELAEADSAPDMRFRLEMDGRRVTRDSYVPVFKLRDVPEGRHRLEVLIVDRDGRVLERSAPVPFAMVHDAGPYED